MKTSDFVVVECDLLYNCIKYFSRRSCCVISFKVADVMHAVLGTHKEGSVPFFEQLLPDFNALIVSITYKEDNLSS